MLAVGHRGIPQVTPARVMSVVNTDGKFNDPSSVRPTFADSRQIRAPYSLSTDLSGNKSSAAGFELYGWSALFLEACGQGTSCCQKLPVFVNAFTSTLSSFLQGHARYQTAHSCRIARLAAAT